ncbi:SbcC/MukB-like Walker B domain-containing protein [Clostridium uliginosum]|uniref:Nuclease SbcCD subunit C n=1 Tax=Clostridium uliginosum TaxID=119641 RepID=A0A1I1PXI7_9CLOT|nr:exonuclease SbcC [Clostridium uliginosum]
MRPIKLKIKGLNSFIEEQTIDFNKLTDRGFFGIFGPTGSGKSTILDGITLALYGEISRKSSNYINTNCDRLNVSFEFQISGTEVRRYVVSREFKRGKEGNIKTTKAKIVDITNTEEVLDDKSKAVTKKCEEIIGLGLDDFTRTVVLPQGKFSEFLKLEGKSRREMLERLFNLQKYGNNLSIKLARETNKEKVENNVLIGQLKGFEDISEDKFKDKNAELELAQINLNNASNELKNIEKTYKDSQEVWDLQLELSSYKEHEEKLNIKSKEIEDNKLKLKLGECALKVNPYIISYENILKESVEVQAQIKELEEKFKILKAQKEDAEKKLIVSRERKDNEVPELKIKEQKINDGIEEKKYLDILECEIKDTEIKVIELRAKYKKYKNIQDDIEQKIILSKSKIKSLEEDFDKLKIDENLKIKVQKGLIVSEKYNLLDKNIRINKEKITTINNDIKNEKLQQKDLEKLFKENSNLLDKDKNNLEELIKNSPGKQEVLLVLQKELSKCTDKWDKFKLYSDDVKKSQVLIEEFKELLEKNSNEKINVESKLSSLKEKYKKIELENLAFKIRRDLKEGEACPVCGSLEHHIKHIKNKNEDNFLKDINLGELEKEISLNENKAKEIDKEITVGKTRITSEKEKIKEKQSELESLGEDFKKSSVEDLKMNFNKLQKDLEDYKVKKESLEDKVNKLKDENHVLENKVSKISTIIKEKETQLVLINDEHKNNLGEFNKISEDLTLIKEETKVDDFKQKSDDISDADKKRDGLSNQIKEIRFELESLGKEKDKIQSELNEVKEEGTEASTSLKEKKKNRDEKINLIRNKLLEESDLFDASNNIKKGKLIELLHSVQKGIESIEKQFKLDDEFKLLIDGKYQECNEKVISAITKQNELNKRSLLEKDNLNTILKEEDFESIEEVKKNIISKKDIEELKIEIEKYKEDLSKIKGAIEGSIKKLNNREVTEEQWVKVQSNLEEKQSEIKILNEAKIKLDEELKFISNKLKELKDLVKKKEKLDHKLALLDDLDKLFKGKKFVEFVAITQLKYISKQASKKLKEITNGNYGLEVDENGKFIIRDYKNGGAERDASTLSGGETFLTSLALALALSSQIQLKGTAPLELFFLDEGFGTLDDNLLEVVMNSLEKLHNDKLKVGIISHVEAIKNRVPVKLILTPAESGEGGSKVRLERS